MSIFILKSKTIYQRFRSVEFSETDLKTIGTISVSLLTLCAVITIQIFNGFQKEAGSLIIIILSAICIITLLCATFKNRDFKQNKWTLKWNISLVLIILVGSLFLSVGLIENLYAIEVTFNYPVDGNPLPRHVSMSGEYRNINNETNSVWLYTYSNNFYLESVQLIPIYPGANKGTWVVTNSIIGGENKSEEGSYYTLGFIVVPKSEENDYANFSIQYTKHGNNYLPKTPHSIKLDYNISVFRLYTT